MSQQFSFGHNASERASRYKILASLFCLSGADASRRALLELCAECDADAAIPENGESYQRMRAWLDSEEGRPLRDELRTMFGAGLCGKAIPVLPSCEAYFAENPDTLRSEILGIWQDCEYEPTQMRPPCEGPGYIGHELAFVAYCLENCAEREELAETAERFVRDHLMQWGPLFAAALAGSTRHPAVRFVADALQSFLGSERDILDGVHAAAS